MAARVRSLPLLLSVLLLAPLMTGASELSSRARPSEPRAGAKPPVGDHASLSPRPASQATSGRSAPHAPDLVPAPSGPARASSTPSGWGGYIGSLESQVRRSLDRTHVHVEGAVPPAVQPLPAPGRVGGVSGAAPHEPSAGLGVPRELALGLAIPNPSSRAVMLRLDLPEPAWVRFSVLDVAGRLIEESSERRPAGRISLVWPARNAARAVVPGIYFARVTVNGRVLPTRRWVVIP